MPGTIAVRFSRELSENDSSHIPTAKLEIMKPITPITAVMTRKPATVGPKETMEAVRHILEDRGFHHVPVTEHEKLIGIVTYTDYLRVIRETFQNKMEVRNNDSWLNAILVEDIMTKNVSYLSENSTLEDALEIFNQNKFHSLPVLNDNHQLLGIVTTFDLMRVLEQVFIEQQPPTVENDAAR